MDSIILNSSGDVVQGSFTNPFVPHRISVVIPCFGRPLRTRRTMMCLLSQTISEWEAFFIGDGCPHFENMIKTGEVDFYQKLARSQGNTLHCFNTGKNLGGFGHSIMNFAVKNATGKYFIFAANDDTFKPNHFEHYLSEIENTDLNLVYYNTHIIPQNYIRVPVLRMNHIGHSECIFVTDKLRQIETEASNKHDWEAIKTYTSQFGQHKKSVSSEYTYEVRGLQSGKYCSDDID